jgi:D-proline reductase (dithiol) PrdB
LYPEEAAMPIAYIARTRERYAGFAPYKWTVNADAPWTPLARPLASSRVALISSGGFYLDGQPPYEENDTSIRAIPKGARVEDLRIYHHGYRDADPDRDPNCIFPIERFRELEAAGVIGSFADPALSFVMVYSPRREITERAPAIVAALRAARADAALLVPV